MIEETKTASCKRAKRSRARQCFVDKGNNERLFSTTVTLTTQLLGMFDIAVLFHIGT